MVNTESIVDQIAAKLQESLASNNSEDVSNYAFAIAMLQDPEAEVEVFDLQ